MIKTPLSIALGGAFWTPGATVISGNALTLDQQIQKLFANGEQGFFYDPDDLSTMFRDAAGTIPVTAAVQPVGLMLDKSGRNNHAYQTTSAARPILQQTPILGNELVVNGDFSNGLNGWQNVLTTTTVENGRAKVTYTNGGGLSQDIPVTVGKTYKASSKAENISGDSAYLYVYGSAGFSPILAASSDIAPTLYVTAVTSSIRVYLNKAGAGEAYWDDISVKEVTGYRTNRNYLAFDAADDKIITNLQAQLTGCTVIRSVPNVGTQILTGQTIPATYEDNTDHCGLIVINRALTPSETSAITAELNKRAGV